MSDVSALLDDVLLRVKNITTAAASPQDYLNQVGLRFKLYDDDSMPCTAYWEIKGSAGAGRDYLTDKFKKRIISAAIAVMPTLRSDMRGLDYERAKRIVTARPVGRRAIAILTNPEHWKLVSVRKGDFSWPPLRVSSISPG